MYQQVTIIGRLGNDPELRYTPSGTSYCQFSVATSRHWNNDQGVRQEETTWHNVSVWRKQAEHCAQYLNKGSMVMVTGNVKARGYTNRDGQVAASLDVTADQVRFLSGGKQGDTMNQSAPVTDNDAPGGNDIPF